MPLPMPTVAPETSIYAINLPALCKESCGSFSEEQMQVDCCFVERTDPVLSHTDTKIVGITKQQDHCSFAICIKTNKDQFVVNKRYSEFRQFRDQVARCSVQRLGCGLGPCRLLKSIVKARFPKRQLKLRQEEIARNRIKDLDLFLTSILRSFKASSRRNQRLCEQKQCALYELVIKFLQLDQIEVQQQRDSLRGSGCSSRHKLASSPTVATALYPITEDCEVHYDME